MDHRLSVADTSFCFANWSLDIQPVAHTMGIPNKLLSLLLRHHYYAPTSYPSSSLDLVLPRANNSSSSHRYPSMSRHYTLPSLHGRPMVHEFYFIQPVAPPLQPADTETYQGFSWHLPLSSSSIKSAKSFNAPLTVHAPQPMPHQLPTPDPAGQKQTGYS